LGSSGPDWDALRLAIDSAVILLGSANYRIGTQTVTALRTAPASQSGV
jgi:hypothetical protein